MLTHKFFHFGSLWFSPVLSRWVGSEQTTAWGLSCCMGWNYYIWLNSQVIKIPSISTLSWQKLKKNKNKNWKVSPSPPTFLLCFPWLWHEEMLGKHWPEIFLQHITSSSQHDGQWSRISSDRHVCPHHKGTTQITPQELKGCQHSWELPHDFINAVSCITTIFFSKNSPALRYRGTVRKHWLSESSTCFDIPAWQLVSMQIYSF